eukprot:CAMPEP_0176429288 /NCGR_PEP_ID=MMETSP0127-20121128/13632_1 /TAXON_ID=938130 /ORGANISM="Platyophrya macrostoma, Strain WH" /LENGTH=322 /DNA_ID=CAMNT_0017811085 /DNA_START=34 /DNA_END=999 /DNA_ORIENTATION=-
MTRMVPDDFEFERTLGIGAFSKVLVARYIPDGKKYAVKIIAKRQILSAPSDEEKTRLAEVARREMRMLLMCDHPNIVRFHASMQTSDDLMYVTELCEGGELLDAIKRKGTIPAKAARHLAAELVSAVAYLHFGEKKTVPVIPNAPLRAVTILHRDIKPENIMLSDSKHVKLIDFGTAVICETSDKVTDDKAIQTGGARGRAQTFCGTTHYMSPEILKDSFTCIQSDYWAIGCVLFHMLTGKRPFDAPTQYLLIKAILEQEPQYPSFLDPNAQDLISRLLRKNPFDRPPMDEIKKHPYFAHVKSWDGLHRMDISELWQRDAAW